MLFRFAVPALMVFIMLPGCNQSPSPTETTESSTIQNDGHTHDDGEMAKMEEGLASLSEEDRTSAKAQHVCPVSGEMLGTMGEPEKVDVNGQNVWICCAGCKDKLLESPDEYLAKLKQ